MTKKYSFTEFTPERWRAMLYGEQVLLNAVRRFNKLIPTTTRCKVCNTPLTGPVWWLYRMSGARVYPKNPRFCTNCLWTGKVGGLEIELTMLFADVRGSTGIAENISSSEYGQRLNRFYKAATNAMVRTDAWLDNLVGDGVIALYIPGFAGEQHAKKGIAGARALLEGTGHADPDGPWMPVGVAVHTGVAYVGLMGSEGGVSDLTAVGDAMNTTARLSSAAGTGEIIVSDSTCSTAGIDVAGLEHRRLELKGRSEPVSVHVMRVMSE
jgi:adenylate cyclase